MIKCLSPRSVLAGFLAVTLGTAPALAQSCVQPAEQTAFNIIALKSALMVGALSCGQAGQYNAFMAQFQPYILSQQHVLDTYFARTDGLYAQPQEDAYITQLANTQSQTSLSIGTGFCDANQQIFSDISALSTPADLDVYVITHTPSQPEHLVPCETTQASVAQPNPAEAAAAAEALVQSQPPPPAPPHHAKLTRIVRTNPPRHEGKTTAPVLTTQQV